MILGRTTRDSDHKKILKKMVASPSTSSLLPPILHEIWNINLLNWIMLTCDALMTIINESLTCNALMTTINESF